MNAGPGSIVVGLNDTAASRAALSFAWREADRRGSALDVVTAWTRRTVTDLPGSSKSREWTRAYAQEVQDTAVAAVLRGFEGASMMSRQVVEGEAAQVLLRMARTADYLVVGSGHKGTMRRMLLGSVSEHCVRHAQCPVLVVPPPSEVGDSAGSELTLSAQL